jgi:hypothetical protein
LLVGRSIVVHFRREVMRVVSTGKLDVLVLERFNNLCAVFSVTKFDESL